MLCDRCGRETKKLRESDGRIKDNKKAEWRKFSVCVVCYLELEEQKKRREKELRRREADG